MALSSAHMHAHTHHDLGSIKSEDKICIENICTTWRSCIWDQNIQKKKPRTQTHAVFNGHVSFLATYPDGIRSCALISLQLWIKATMTIVYYKGTWEQQVTLQTTGGTSVSKGMRGGVGGKAVLTVLICREHADKRCAGFHTERTLCVWSQMSVCDWERCLSDWWRMHCSCCHLNLATCKIVMQWWGEQCLSPSWAASTNSLPYHTSTHTHCAT